VLKGIGREATYYYHPDHLGSVSVVSNHRGEPYERVEYLPFGEIWIEETDPATGYIPFRFTSKELDEETGLYYYGARYYEPTISRWMSPDPAGFELVNPMGSDGELRAGYSVIEALNWYAYVSNNPVKYVDPTGLSEVVGTDTKNDPILAQNYKPESAQVNIDRPTDGYRNGFDSNRTVDVTMENGQTMRTGSDNSVSANRTDPEYARDVLDTKLIEGFTLPDGEYSFTTDGLTENLDGTASSASYDNTYRYQTNDESIPEETRDYINNAPFLNHANSNRGGDTWINNSYSAGCTSQRGGQAGQNTFMNQLAGVAPGNVTITIKSRNRVKRGVK